MLAPNSIQNYHPNYLSTVLGFFFTIVNINIHPELVMRKTVYNAFIRMLYSYKGLLSNIDYPFNKIAKEDNT